MKLLRSLAMVILGVRSAGKGASEYVLHLNCLQLDFWYKPYGEAARILSAMVKGHLHLKSSIGAVV